MESINISSLRGIGGAGGTGVVSLFGPDSVLRDSVNTYTITNYDSFSIYSVTSNVGEVEISGDTITLMVPAGTPERVVAVTVSRNSDVRVFRIALGGVSVVTPIITSPPYGSTNIPASTTIQATSFSTVPVGAGSHLSSEWQIARDIGFSDIVHSETMDSGNLTRLSVENLPNGTYLYARVRYVSDLETSEWSPVVSFSTTFMQIAKPVISIEGQEWDVKETPTFTSSAFFAAPEGSDTHVASTWILRGGNLGEIIWQRSHTTTNRTSITIPAGVLEVGREYSMEVQYIGGFGTSVFSDRLIFSTTSSFTPEEPGVPFGGGFYAGANILVDGVEYALVVAPRSQGGEAPSPLQWKTSTTNTTGTDSLNNGRANTAAMISAGASLHPAANFCNNLTINGHDDWHFPSQDELEICYRYLKPTTQNNNTSHGTNPSSVPPTGNYTSGNPSQTSVAIFQAGGGEHFDSTYYWSSTQHSSTGARYQYFHDGSQYAHSKTFSRRVRAVRWVQV